MLDYKDILNKYYVIKLSAREISRQTGMSKSGVQKFIHAFEKCDDLDFPLPPGITNSGIAMKVYGKVPGEGGQDERVTCRGRLHEPVFMTIIISILWLCLYVTVALFLREGGSIWP